MDLITPLSFSLPSGHHLTRMEKRYFEAKNCHIRTKTIMTLKKLGGGGGGGQHWNSIIDILLRRKSGFREEEWLSHEDRSHLVGC